MFHGGDRIFDGNARILPGCHVRSLLFLGMELSRLGLQAQADQRQRGLPSTSAPHTDRDTETRPGLWWLREAAGLGAHHIEVSEMVVAADDCVLWCPPSASGLGMGIRSWERGNPRDSESDKMRGALATFKVQGSQDPLSFCLSVCRQCSAGSPLRVSGQRVVR